MELFAFWRNPEFIRLTRTRLRPTAMALRVLGVNVGLGGLVLLSWYGAMASTPPVSNQKFFEGAFHTLNGLQLLVLGLYGLTLGVQAVSIERERHTYDFQRLVGMGSTKLAIGKLFGAGVDSWFVALCFIPLQALCVASGGVEPGLFFQLLLHNFLFGLVVQSVALLCSSLVSKTAMSSGLALLLGGGLVCMVCVATFPFLEMQNRDAWSFWGMWLPGCYLPALLDPPPGTTPYCPFLGWKLPLSAGAVISALFLAGLATSLVARRIEEQEFSMLSAHQALFWFVTYEILLVGGAWGRVDHEIAPFMFHAANWCALVALAFLMSPGGELLKGRVSRHARDQHWAITFDFRNAYEDAPAISASLVAAGVYVFAALTLWPFPDLLSLPSVCGILVVTAGSGIATAGFLTWTSAYFEKGATKICVAVLLVGLIVPPLVLALFDAPAFLPVFNPICYLGLATAPEEFDIARYVMGPMPLNIFVLAFSGIVLAALRFRYLLDLQDFVAKRDAKAAAEALRAVARE